MVRRTEDYLDTSGLIAFLDRSDSHHEIFRALFATDRALVTTPLVVAEGHGWFLRRFDRTRALQFLSFLDDLKTLEVLPVDAATLTTARQILKRYSDQDLTLADATGLQLMRSRRISRCWSTDRHMRLLGARLAIDAE